MEVSEKDLEVNKENVLPGENTQESFEDEQPHSTTQMVLLPLTNLPNCRRPGPLESLVCEYFTLDYYKPAVEQSTGHYELVTPGKPDHILTLYQSGMRSLVRNLPMAIQAAKSLLSNPDLQVPENTYEVCTINTYNGLSTRLIVSAYNDEAFIYVRLLTTNEKNETYPTRKSARISITDDLPALAAFIKDKK